MSRFAKHVSFFVNRSWQCVVFVRNVLNSHAQGKFLICTMKGYASHIFSTTVRVGLLLVGWPAFQRGYFGPEPLRLTGPVLSGIARYLGEYYLRAVIGRESTREENIVSFPR